MVTIQHVSPLLPNHHLPLSAFLTCTLYLLINSPTSFLCLKVTNQFTILLPNWVLGSLLLGKFNLKSSLPSKKTLVDALLSSPPGLTSSDLTCQHWEG